MAVERFTELLHKLKEVHEQEVEGWQEKVQELTNKKNCDAKRLEELYSRNQQLREQQRVLTENIKQLENMLRAGLCDRCTVTQEVAKKRQQEYESAQLQSLQHISILMAEISTLMKENSRLRGDLKRLESQDSLESLGRRVEEQNGDSEEAGTLEVKLSPDPASSTFTLVTSMPKPELPPAGGAFVSTATVKSETERSQCTEPLAEREKISGSDNKHLQAWGGTHPFESSEVSALATGGASLAAWRDRRAASADSLLPQLSPTSPSHPHHLRLLRPFISPSSSDERLAPLRPHPIKTAPPTLHWPIPEHSDWVAAGTGDSRAGDKGGGAGIMVQPKPNQDSTVLHFPGLLSPPGGFESNRPARAFPHLRSPTLWAPSVCLGRKSLPELVDSQGRSKPASVIAPCSKSAAVQPRHISEDSVKERVEEDAPLDLSSATGSKAKETEMVQRQCRNEVASPSSSSPDAPLSSPCSVQYGSSPQSDPQAGDSKAQSEKTWERPKEEHDEEKEKNKNADFSTNQKAPTLTISLRPVVILESLKTRQQTDPGAEPRDGPQEREEDDDRGRSATRKRGDQTPEAVPRHLLKEKRMRVTVIPEEPSQEDTERG